MNGDTFETFGKVFGVGGIGLAALWIVMRSRFWKNGNNSSSKSGERSVEEWEGRMRVLQEDANENLMEDIRALVDARTAILTEKVTEPIVKEIRALRDDLSRRPKF